MTEKISYIEIDLSRCSEVYSVGACAASIPATGTIKCFNCFATCQDKTNYNKEIVTSRHSTASGDLPINIDAIPDIKSISIKAAKLDLGESMGQRASISVTFGDGRYPDTGPEGDRYLADRDYDPYTVGTYWGKFRARYPFTQGADIRLIRGDSNKTLAQMETRHFIVDSVAGPDSKGKFSLVAKDALKLTDGKKAQAPVLSQGELSADISASATSFTLLPTGVGNSGYPANGFLNLSGDEIVSFTRSNDVMTIVRAQFNTTAIEHETGARAQLCLRYVNQKVSTIIANLLIEYSNVPASYISISDWELEDDANINKLYSGLIAEPESASDLINELLLQTASTVWWDDVSKLIRFRALKAVGTGAATYSDDLILGGTFSAKDQNNKRVSQVWTYFGQINPLESLTDNKNYSRAQVNISIESQNNFEGTPSVKRIYSRWIGNLSRATAEKLNELILQRYSTAPRMIAFNLQKDDLLTIPSLGSGYNVNTRNLQGATGANETMPIQVIQMKSSDSGYAVMGEEVLYSSSIIPDDITIKTIPLETDYPDGIDFYALAISPEFSESAPVTGDTYNFTLLSGKTIGSDSTSSSAIVTGTGWPVGVTINFINNGTVAGKGGPGGRGGSVNYYVAGKGLAGGNGGDCISADYDLNIINNIGGIIGGGGGGGGGGGSVWYYDGGPGGVPKIRGNITGSGGGAGAGLNISLGGALGSGLLSGVNIQGILGGNSSSNTQQGSGGASVTSLAPNVRNGSGGDGGGLAATGQAGQNGYYPIGYTPTPYDAETSNGGLGGLGGSAINKNGNTVTITNNGTISGAINA
mgnify:CR=1 FL=1